jgi:hypothetical protein
MGTISQRNMLSFTAVRNVIARYAINDTDVRRCCAGCDMLWWSLEILKTPSSFSKNQDYSWGGIN